MNERKRGPEPNWLLLKIYFAALGFAVLCGGVKEWLL